MARATDTQFVRGAERLSRRIQTIRENLQLPDMTDAAAELLRRRMIDRFTREIDPDYQQWKELKDSTIRRRKYLGLGPHPILKRTGTLKDSIKVLRGNFFGYGVATGAGRRIGVEDEEVGAYARVHNQGIGVTKRRFLGIGALDVKAVDGLLRRKARQLEKLWGE